MEKIVSQSAIQTREDSTYKLERLFPVLVAEAISRIHEARDQKAMPRIDFWNTYGLKTEVQFAHSIQFPNREAYINGLIKARVDILKEKFGISGESRLSLRDDNQGVEEFVLQVLQDLFARGIVKIEEMDVICCEKCSLVIAPVGVKPEKCKKCNLSEFSPGREKLLVINVTDTQKNKLVQRGRTSGFQKVADDYTNNCPERIIISKQREFGLSLESFGIDSKFKLDPKVVLALQGAIYREMFGIEDCTLVQGTDSIKNTFPLAVILDDHFDTKYLPVGYLPKVDINEVNEQDPGFVMPFLAISAGGRMSSISLNQFNALRRQFQKTRIKIQNCLKLCDILNEHSERDTGYSGEELDIALALQDLPYRTSEAVRRIVYDVLSGQYLTRCKQSHLKVDDLAVAQLKQINNLFYGQTTENPIPVE